MPELPEVAGLAAFLSTRLSGAVVTKIQITSFAALKTADPPYSALEGREITGVDRFGKFVCLRTDGMCFVFHLARAGWLRYTESPSAAQLLLGQSNIAARLGFARTGPDAHIGMDLTEAGTKKSLAVYVVRDPMQVPGIAALGPDPFHPDFDVRTLARILASSRQQIKGLLRNQNAIAGIGNAYSDEILHAARISPFAIASSFDIAAVEVLWEAVHTVLGAAVTEAVGKEPGELKETKRTQMRVHGRAGQPCPVCADTVREVSFADTALQYCPTCQTEGRILADRRASRFLK
ncbi:DNA-formamidopyrimidine glycosylase family protein [Pseudarthrobacter sp. N5]|uniref:DNA-formamidopyrimidine glycosylase family protein n=1 Tax=Pseudarthrobacter sp. N5 TaxID=3418416 RepID=UPI003CE8E3DF